MYKPVFLLVAFIIILCCHVLCRAFGITDVFFPTDKELVKDFLFISCGWGLSFVYEKLKELMPDADDEITE